MGVLMPEDALIFEKTKSFPQKIRRNHGLENLAIFYQRLFEIEENVHHYNQEDFRTAKRKFVKYLMDHRTL